MSFDRHINKVYNNTIMKIHANRPMNCYFVGTWNKPPAAVPKLKPEELFELNNPVLAIADAVGLAPTLTYLSNFLLKQ